MEHIIYLDNSATTKPCDTAIKRMNEALNTVWGNPSSLHSMGVDAEILLNDARTAIAKKINANQNEIFFTASGTEANNTAIMTASFRKSRGNRIITTNIEHPSVLETVKRLENDGFEVIRLAVDKNGIISLNDLENALNDKTVLVSIMLVNNEIGSIQPIKEAVTLTKRIAPQALFHCDAVQAFGKMPINVNDLKIDLLSCSGHKIHAPKGVGFLYCKKGVSIKPLITGGGQEKGLRSGTEPMPNIAGFLGAVEELENIETRLKKIAELNSYAKDLFGKSGFIKINSPENALPYILNISVIGYRSETLLHFLESKNIFVSSGSACSKGEPSHVLMAIGLTKNESDSALRLSFSNKTTKEDIDITFEALKEATEKLRRSKI